MKTVQVCLILLSMSGCLMASDFILRASPECCNKYPDFGSGSVGVLLKDGKRVADARVNDDSPFIFKKTNAGKYDLVLSVVDCYPIKLLDVEPGQNGVWDFELVSSVYSTAIPILEGQLTVYFRSGVADSVILRKIGEFGLAVFQTSPYYSKYSKNDNGIRRTTGYAEVRCTYDRSRRPEEIMLSVLLDSAVTECVPTYFAIH